MKRLALQLFLSIFLSSIGLPVFATDLLTVYQQALQSDPVYQAAKFTMLANQEALPQSEASLLPNLSANANTNGNYVNTLSIQGVNNTTTFGDAQLGPTRFNSNGYAINLTQPIFNFGNWMQVKQASNLYKQAAATYSAALQDLIIRVARAYFNVLEAQDNLSYLNAEVKANHQELIQTQERYEVGLDAMTSVYDARASYDALVAQQFAAQNNVRNALEAVRQLTGEYYDQLAGLKITLPLLYPQPLDVEKWVTTATQFNQTLLAARYGAEAARAAVKVNFANHLPSLDAVGSYQQADGAGLGTTNYRQGIVGLEVNVPLFQGGLVNSQVRQAEDNYAASSANMENVHRQTALDTRQSFNNILSGISQIQADRQAILSAQNSLITTQESYKAGTRNIVDVLDAIQQLYEVKTNYAQDQYNYLLSTLLLKQAAGTLSPQDLVQINHWLQ